MHVIKTGYFGLGRKASEFTTPRRGSTPTNCLKTTFSPSSINTVNNKNTYTSQSHCHATRKGYSIGCTFSSPPGGTVAFTRVCWETFKLSFFTLQGSLDNSPSELDDRASWCSVVCICVCPLSSEEKLRCFFLVHVFLSNFKTCFLNMNYSSANRSDV